MSRVRPSGGVGWRTGGMLTVGAVVAAAGVGAGTVNAADSAPIVMTATVTVSGAVNATYQVQETEDQLQQNHDCTLTSDRRLRGNPIAADVGLAHNIGIAAGGFRGKSTRLPHGEFANAYFFTTFPHYWTAGEVPYFKQNVMKHKAIGSGTVWFASDGKSGWFDFTSPGRVAKNGRIVRYGRIHAHGVWSCPTVTVHTHN